MDRLGAPRGVVVAGVYQDKKRRNPDGSLKWVLDLRTRKRGREYTEAKSRDEALKMLGARLAELDNERGATGALTFMEFTENDYLPDASIQNSATTNVADRSRARVVMPFFGPLPLVSIDRAVMKRYIAKRAGDGLAPATINRERMFVSAVLSAAVDLERIPKNPLRGMPQLREDNDATRWFTGEEMRRIIDGARGLHRVIILIAVHAGCRLGEVVGLRWWHVDLEARTIQIAKAKDHQSRILHMNDEVVRIFSLMPRGRSNDRIFTITASAVSHAMTRLMRRLGIEEASFRTLRHTFGTRGGLAGLPTKDLQELLGHATARMTKRYRHVTPALRQAMNEIHAVSRGTEILSAEQKLPFKEAN